MSPNRAVHGDDGSSQLNNSNLSFSGALPETSSDNHNTISTDSFSENPNEAYLSRVAAESVAETEAQETADDNGEAFNYMLVDPALLAESGMSQPSAPTGAMDGAMGGAMGPPAVGGATNLPIPATIPPPPPPQPQPQPIGAQARPRADVPMPATTKLTRLVDMDDPYCCSLCFHAYTTVSGVKTHLKQVHQLTQAQIKAAPDHQNPKTLSHFSNLGIDVTYHGSDPKQINARRRMAAGLKSTDQGYWNDAY